MSKNFCVVDGNEDYLNYLDDFIRLYEDLNISIPMLQKQLGINQQEYKKLLKYCKDFNLVTLRDPHSSNKKHRKLNFHVVDGDSSYLERVPEFVKLYNNLNISTSGLREKMGINRQVYKNLLDYCKCNDLIHLRGCNHQYNPNDSNNLHITIDYHGPRHYFHVQKCVNGENVSFGSYRKFTVAEQIRDKLIECNWDKGQLERIKMEVLCE